MLLPMQEAGGEVTIRQFPHCDAMILHAPGECEYCDRHPDWQQLREVWQIAFTGHSPEMGGTACPSETHRDIETINRWPGNRPHPKES